MSQSTRIKSQDIRSTFIRYFEKNGHRHVASSSLVPENDATLLFANAGMNQFKNLFLGLEKRDYSRAVTSQKCVRAGGKHNDLENVGFTARHHTFFEMLGNFSFGDYFKKDAIHMAWDLLTRELEIPRDRLYVTVFLDDDEAAEIWHKQEGVPKDRILRFGEKDNFWRMGDTGPCGPCTEIFYDHGPEADLDPTRPSKMGGDGDRYVEIWNNVFMQFNEDGKGRHPLPRPSVDTGAGLERWAAMLNGQPNNYDTDLFLPIIHKAAQISRLEYINDATALRKSEELRQRAAALRVIADHSRAAAFLIADGVLPSNEGRGYVLRRILRRAIRYGRKLTNRPDLFPETVAVVVSEMSSVYPELQRAKDLILTTVRDEVSRFIATLDQGTEILNDAIAKLVQRGGKTIEGETLFKLYDTYGFPVDLTRLMASERGLAVDEAGFEGQLELARERAKSSSKFKALSTNEAHLIQWSNSTRSAAGATSFLGYAGVEAKAQVQSLSDGQAEVRELNEGAEGLVILNQTSFYAEGGGQVGDTGLLRAPAGEAEVFDTTKLNEIHIHHVRVTRGRLALGDSVLALVQDGRRRSTANNHSATHLLHAALRKVLGSHITQAGSQVNSDRLRFDFTHGKPVTSTELEQIETLVNGEIARGQAVEAAEMVQKDALAAGALALFGEKYGDVVRVIKMGEFSTELCGGTHVSNTSSIRVFKVISEGGVSAGVRRIEAVTGDAAVSLMMKAMHEVRAARELIGDQPIVRWIEQSRETAKAFEREIKQLKSAAIDVDGFVKSAKSFSKASASGRLVLAAVDVDDRQVLADLTDKIKSKLGLGVVVLVGHGDISHPVIVSVSKELTSAGLSAGQILAEVAKEMGGKGGGRPDFAQGAAPDRSKLVAAFARAESLLLSN
jgi:alanyl-tRNA synthetase